jgi:hypothetical protein
MILRRFYGSALLLAVLNSLSLATPILAQNAPPGSSVEATALVRRTLVENRHDLEALRNYIYVSDETDEEYKDNRVTKTTVTRQENFTIDGEPVTRTLLVNGQPPAEKDRRKEEKELDEKTADAHATNPKHKEDREKKAAKELAEQMAVREDVLDAYNFTILGEETHEGHRLVKIAAEPKDGFKGKSKLKVFLPVLHGTLIIDATSNQWIDIHATMVRKLGGGPMYVGQESAIHLHQASVADGLWVMTDGSIRINARLLFLHKNIGERVSFHDFRRFGSEVRIVETAESLTAPTTQAKP